MEGRDRAREPERYRSHGLDPADAARAARDASAGRRDCWGGRADGEDEGRGIDL